MHSFTTLENELAFIQNKTVCQFVELSSEDDMDDEDFMDDDEDEDSDASLIEMLKQCMLALCHGDIFLRNHLYNMKIFSLLLRIIFFQKLLDSIIIK